MAMLRHLEAEFSVFEAHRDVQHGKPTVVASPLEAFEDEFAITLTFSVPLETQGPVRVRASDDSITVVRAATPGNPEELERVCALPCTVHPSSVQTDRSGDLLRVRLRKKRPAIASSDASLSA